jgi:myo-inositol 2-dehydrogenase/D-chiro-inositol 1-dehydrogenase
MKLALNGATTMRADLLTEIKAAQAAGFDYLEIWASKLRDFLRHNSVADLRQHFLAHHIQPLSINSIEHITFRDAESYESIKQQCWELSSIAAQIGCQIKMNRGELLKPLWTGDPTVTGGFLFETTIHMFDMVRFLFGEIESLMAIGSKHEYAEVDDFSVLLRFANGMHATLCSSADASWLFPFERVEVFCHHSTLVTREMETLVCSSDLAGHFTEQSMQQLQRDEKWGYVQEDRAFIDAIANNTAPPVTAFDGLMSVKLVDAVYRSVDAGRKAIDFDLP